MKHQEGHYKLCQYAFGDESNSLHVVLNSNEMLNDLWNSITNHSNGVLCELTCRLYKAKKYIDYYREEFSPLNIYFINKVAKESTGFLLEPIEYDIKKNYAALNYYCTAYVWIMFESVTDEDSCFQPSRAITFFEHANLANKDSYEACINSLITKCFEHFDRMFSIDNVEKKYRYCLSMNPYIESKFFDRYKTRIKQDDELSQKYRSNVIINMSCSESDVFSSFDAFFSNSYDDLTLMEVSIQDKRSVALLGEYYASIYIDSFPKDERESLDNIIDYLNKKENGWYGKNNYHVILAIGSGVIVGGLICDYFERSNCGVIEFIAVKKECRSEGIGTRLYQKAIELLRKDARNNKKNNIDYIFCEIEKADADSNKDAIKYLWFWNKMGYRKILFNYIQPALSDGKENVNNLDLIALQLNENIKSHKGIEATTIKSFLLDYARYAMRIEEPEKNITISRMIEEIDSFKTSIIKTETII
ncbi:MAG: GNAT family N-acetyltransferase [Caulobacteraceae bacterium]